MSITCPRCTEQVDGAPDGCRDPACPRLEIEELERDQHDSIMAAGKAESAANVAYGAAKDAVIAAAREIIIGLSDDEGEWPERDRARIALKVLDALEKRP